MQHFVASSNDIWVEDAKPVLTVCLHLFITSSFTHNAHLGLCVPTNFKPCIHYYYTPLYCKAQQRPYDSWMAGTTSRAQDYTFPAFVCAHALSGAKRHPPASINPPSILNFIRSFAACAPVQPLWSVFHTGDKQNQGSKLKKEQVRIH